MATTADVKRQLIDALRSCGAGWHDRKALAQALGKRVLNVQETTVLDVMADQGEIEKSIQPTPATAIFKIAYKLKE